MVKGRIQVFHYLNYLDGFLFFRFLLRVDSDLGLLNPLGRLYLVVLMLHHAKKSLLAGNLKLVIGHADFALFLLI